MSSPMFDLPDHLPMDINANGQGPADPDEAVATVCWTCGTTWPCSASTEDD